MFKDIIENMMKKINKRMLIFKIQDLDGFESWLYFGSKYGCNSYILLYNYACFSFSNNFFVTYGNVCKDSRFGNKL